MSFSWPNGLPAWLPARTIFVTRHGGHAYGTSLPTSDIDVRGVAIAPERMYLGFQGGFEQATVPDPDLVVFELRKFLRLAFDCNPNALELLFTNPSDHLVVTPLGERLLASRHLFLSRKAKHTFSGYAASQLARIRLHHRWLREPPSGPPIRSDFGLGARPVVAKEQLAASLAAIRKRMETWSWHSLDGVDPATRQAVQDDFARRLAELSGAANEADDRAWAAAGRALGYDTNFLELLDRERRYAAKVRDHQAYEEWKRSRNPARAELEARYGYDTKHAMHLVRLLRMCRELLTQGTLIVRRPDATELLAIRNGALTYEALLAWATEQDAELAELARVSPLPASPDAEAVNDLCVELVRASLGLGAQPACEASSSASS